MSYAYNNPTKVETEAGSGYPHQQPPPASSYPPQPAYTMQANQAPPTSVVVTSPVTPMNVVVQNKETWSWAVTITSIVTMFLCSPGWICGFIGLVNAIHAYVDHKVADYRRAAHKRQCAWGFTIAGIVIGVIVWIIIIALAVTGALAAQAAMNSYYNNFNG